jgi:flagellar basal-body rod protein FlgB
VSHGEGRASDNFPGESQVDGGIVDVLQFALDGVTDQTNAIANNLANSQTPNYTASDVSFQQSLALALNSPGEATASITTTPSTNPAGSNGNNVDFGTELVSSEQSALEYQQLSQSLNDQFRLIRGVVGGGWS